MAENTSDKTAGKPKIPILFCYFRAATVGAVAALSGAFAFCVYDGYARLHEGLCNCAKYGAMVTAALSHPLVIMGALSGVCVLSTVYLAKLLFRICRHQRHG
jgi:hypothetical protein